jgi:phenylacetate-CoA ligase
MSVFPAVPAEHALPPAALGELQRQKLAAMWETVLGGNRFYQAKFTGIDFDPRRDSLSCLPLTTRRELEQDQALHPPYGTNLSYDLEAYPRLHQTSGSGGGRPMRWLDTPQSWAWWKSCWGQIFQAAGIGRGDVVLFPFSFGPFIGFWSAFEGALELGCRALAAGGMTSSARVRFLIDNQAKAVCCTPTYALHLAEVAAGDGVDLRQAGIAALVVAGEPGGSIPATRQRIEEAWGARVFDHTGMTEAGPIGFQCGCDAGSVHVLENEHIVEVIDPVTLKEVGEGQAGELVVTNLGRWGSPVIRYRTGDQVRLKRGRCACGRTLCRMEGGILGRSDDMFTIRGNNVFPASLEAIIRRVPEVAEFRIQVDEEGGMNQLRIEIETTPAADGQQTAGRVARLLQDTLNFRPEVRVVRGLPRFEMKARRLVWRESERKANEKLNVQNASVQR